MCGRDSEDPLVRRLYRQDRLCLVRVPRSPDELKPGSVVVAYPDSLDRPPVVYEIGDVFSPIPAIVIRDGTYQPLNITERTSQLSLETVAELSAAMGGGLVPGELALALEAARSTTFSLKLDGGRRADLDVGRFETEFRRSRPTREGVELIEQGARLHVVTRTVTARQVELSGSREIDAGVRAKLEALGSARLKLALKDASTIVMARSDEDLVVGFQILEAVVREDDIALRGARGPVAVRGGAGEFEALDPADIAEEGSVFAAPSVRRRDAVKP